MTDNTTETGYFWGDISHFPCGELAALPDADTPATPAVTPESRARETISDLLHGKLRPATVKDMGDAVERAKSNGAVGKVFR